MLAYSDLKAYLKLNPHDDEALNLMLKYRVLERDWRSEIRSGTGSEQ